MKQRDILLILVPTFIMVVLWVAFSIYHNHVSSTVSEPLSLQIEPINPRFDTETMDELKNRERLSPIYEKVGSSTPEDESINEDTEIATPSSEASDSALILEEDLLNE